MAALCFSQTPVKEIYIYSWGNYITVETFTWGEDRSQISEYYIYQYGDRLQIYGMDGGYLLWNDIVKENDYLEDYLYGYDYEDDYE